MVAITVQNLVVRRSGTTVLDGLDLSVAAGSLTGLLGPSGSGKTTLLRTLVGLQRITSGSVTVLDRPAGQPRLRAEVGYMTQVPSVYGDLSAADNVRYHAALHRSGAAAVTSALESVDLAPIAHRLVSTMSGGERSRVSLACALVARPRLLLLDEPTVGLDPVLRRDLWKLFRTLARDEGTTLLVSSHVMDEADRCEQLVLLRAGRVVAADTPAALRTATGESRMDEVFLQLIERSEVTA